VLLIPNISSNLCAICLIESLVGGKPFFFCSFKTCRLILFSFYAPNTQVPSPILVDLLLFNRLLSVEGGVLKDRAA
jgi:hypothetical protein